MNLSSQFDGSAWQTKEPAGRYERRRISNLKELWARAMVNSIKLLIFHVIYNVRAKFHESTCEGIFTGWFDKAFQQNCIITSDRCEQFCYK